MACKSLISYSRECESAISAGVGKLYLISYHDLDKVVGSTYAVEGGLISKINVAKAKNFVEVGLLRDTVGITETLAKTPTTGTQEITTQLTLVISNITLESRTFVDTLLNAGEVAAVIELKSGRFIAVGLDGYFEVTGLTGGSGVTGQELNGYNITLTGVESKLMQLVDPVIVPGLTVPAV